MEMTPQLELWLWTIATFALLVGVLSKFAFKPLSRVLEKREQAIQGSLDKAEQARVQAEKILAENDARLDKARDETRKIIQEGHRIVADMKREASDQSRREADRIVSQARTQIDREVQRRLDDLKGTVANLSVRISRQVLKGEMDERRHEELADELIERLKKAHGTRRN
jgi:F-type H+-transporting ATPase subunit b